MKKQLVISFFALIFTLTTLPISNASANEPNFKEIYDQKKASIFRVVKRYKSSSGNRESQGTGFIISKEKSDNGEFTYHVLTNAHVVDGTIEDYTSSYFRQEIGYDLITSDDKTTYDDVKLLGLDPLVDLAVLELKTKQNYPICKFSNRSTLETLEPILVIGNTNLRGVSPNIGKIKNPKTGLNTYDFVTFQHDAIVAGGNSGSPIFDKNGEVIGVHFRGFSDGSIKYGFPVYRAKKAYENILANQTKEGVVYGNWGLTVFPMESYERKALLPKALQGSGIFVNKIWKGSVADKAGIQNGDIILGVDGNSEVADAINRQRMYKFWTMIRDSSAGQKFQIKIYRGHKETGQIINRTLVSQTTAYKKNETHLTKYGFAVSNLFPDALYTYDVPSGIQGVVVTPTKDNYFSSGTIITNVNGKDIKNVTEFKKQVAAIPAKEDLVFRYIETLRSFRYDYLYKGPNHQGFHVIKR